MKHWLLTGELPAHVNSPNYSVEEIGRKLTKRRRSMCGIRKKGITNCAHFATGDQLVMFLQFLYSLIKQTISRFLFACHLHRLLSIVPKTQHVEMITWLVEGKLPEHVKPQTLTLDEIGHKLTRPRKSMKRQNKGQSNAHGFATSDQLKELVCVSGHHCVITSWRTYVHEHVREKPTPYWAMTIDHADPLGKDDNKTKEGIWGTQICKSCAML